MKNNIRLPYRSGWMTVHKDASKETIHALKNLIDFVLENPGVLKEIEPESPTKEAIEMFRTDSGQVFLDPDYKQCCMECRMHYFDEEECPACECERSFREMEAQWDKELSILKERTGHELDFDSFCFRCIELFTEADLQELDELSYIYQSTAEEVEQSSQPSSSKHQATKLILDVSKNLDKEKYLDNNGLPTAEGARAITATLVEGIVLNIHMCHQNEYRDSAEHLRAVIDNITTGFARVANVGEGEIDI